MIEEVVRATLHYAIRRPISERHRWHSNVSTTKFPHVLHPAFGLHLDPHGFQCRALLILQFHPTCVDPEATKDRMIRSRYIHN